MKIHLVRCLRPQASLLVAFFALASCSATGDSIADLASEINATLDTGRVVIAVGDSIGVTFPFKDQWNHEAFVLPDGSASFQLIDAVPVAGLTLADLDTRLTELYNKKRNNQEKIDLTVAVTTAGGGAGVSAVTGRVVYVIGDVNNPGPVIIAGRSLTLIEAIGAAGGHLKATANLRNVILVRKLADSKELRSWRLDADVYNWGSVPPIFLQPHDIVFVPNTAIDDVDIWVDQYIRRLMPFPYLVRPA